MLTTKRFEYVAFEQVHLHPSVANHRPLNEAKVAHYADDIQRNGLLEPLVVWERTPGEFYLVGGFHRYSAIRRIRSAQPGYFDRIDVRVVHGQLDEIQALNLKLNADRLGARITDYFDAIIFMSNANWPNDRIARFLDKNETWVEEILRYAPAMDGRVRRLLEEGRLTWSKAKTICKKALSVPPEQERATWDAALDVIQNPPPPRQRLLTYRTAAKRLKSNAGTFRVAGADVAALLQVIRANNPSKDAIERVRKAFPGLIEN